MQDTSNHHHEQIRDDNPIRTQNRPTTCKLITPVIFEQEIPSCIIWINLGGYHKIPAPTILSLIECVAESRSLTHKDKAINDPTDAEVLWEEYEHEIM
jgi:hypothetical protein